MLPLVSVTVKTATLLYSHKPGIVRAPLLTTIMQVASRFLLVWGVVSNFPMTSSFSPAYSTMLLAWSVTEVIRYSYFAINLAYGYVPSRLTWLRYNAFFVLYPMGISSECWLLWLAVTPAKSWNLAYEYLIKLILFIYIPGKPHFSTSTTRRLLTDCRLIHSVYAHDGTKTEGDARSERKEDCMMRWSPRSL